MILLAASIAALFAGGYWLDSRVQPRARRQAVGLAMSLWLLSALFGLLLIATGAPWLAAGLALGAAALLTTASNAKYAMLGEPLLFSDLALVGALFRHPQFYLSALRGWQVLAIAAGLVGLIGLVALFAEGGWPPRLPGIAIAITALVGQALAARHPAWGAPADGADAGGDVARHGLLPTLLRHWRDWRRVPDPPPVAPVAGARSDLTLVVIVQCESFADPCSLFAGAAPLPHLAAARAAAWQWGRLQVSGFGAYTMRTEYGVLFGREEDDLGLRRFDPYLTASGETSYALPARLAGWRRLFVHPHDLRFYSRDRLMPAIGFTMIGADAFPPPTAGRYVTDAAVADRLLAEAAAAVEPTLLYAVTMENHGPWPDDRAAGRTAADQYVELVTRGDAMLGRLQAGLAALRRPALLVFFGDHRPSIPGVTDPAGPRDTPYVMLRLGSDGQPRPAQRGPVDLTPAGLHRAILNALGATEAPAPAAADLAAVPATTDPAI